MPGAGYDYGNTRVRALLGELFGARAYEEMLGRDLEALLGLLARTPYRPDVEAALPRFSGVARLYEALRANLGRAIRRLRDFFDGAARRAVDLLASRWDAANLVAVLRAQARRAPAEEAAALLAPAGALDEAGLRELLRQPGLRAAVDLLVAWRIPGPEEARAVARAFFAYERTGDLAALEHAAAAAFAARVERARGAAGEGERLVAEALGAEIDQRNIGAALRLREDRLPGGAWLPGGRISPAVLSAAAGADSRGAAAAAIAGDAGAARFRREIERFAEEGDLPRLEAALEARLARDLARLYRREDPLGAAVAISYAWAKETEVRNLRVIGLGAATGMPPDRVREMLVIVT